MSIVQQFKYRSVAWAALAVVIVLCIVLGGGRSLNRERGSVEDVFYNGVKGDGVSIAKDMNIRATAAGKLATLAGNYGVNTEPLSVAIETYDKASGPAELAAANARLETGVYAAYSALTNAALSNADKKSVQSLYDEFNSRGNTMKNDGYNALAEEFNSRTLGAFPASLIAELRGIKPLALFR